MSDYRTYMVQLALQNRWRKGIELGLGSGQLFQRFLSVTNMTMIGVDLGLRPERKAKLEAIQKAYAYRCILHIGLTQEEHLKVPNNWADFIFIDAGHGYHAVRLDIKNWLPKLKTGGWFGGHNYHPKFPGVMKAVNEAFGDRVEVLDHCIWTVKS